MIHNNEGKKGIVFDIQHYSIHDGPGIRTVVFLKGCPLNCKWCQNPESIGKKPEIMYNTDKCIQCNRCVEVCEYDAIENKADGKKIINIQKCTMCLKCVEICPVEALEKVGKKMSVDQVIEEVKKDVVFFRKSKGGLTISGGEVLFQPDFSLEILKECKANYIHTAIETCGYNKWNILKELLKYVDLVLYDIKGFGKDSHKKNTGVDNNLILNNLKKIDKEIKKQVIIRMPIIPKYNDNIEDVKKTAEFLKELNNILEVNLLPYHRLGENKYDKLGVKYELYNVKIPSNDKLKKISAIFEDNNIPVKIGG